MAILHRKVTAIADDGTSDVGSNEWNENHNMRLEGIVPGQRRTAAAARYYIAGSWGASALAAGVAWVTNTQRAFPFIPARDGQIDQVLAEVTTLGTSGRMGIYSDDGNCKPGALLSESSTGAVALSVGVKTWAFAQNVVGGELYWISQNVSGTPVFRSVAVADAIPILGWPATLGAVAAGNGWQQTRVLAALAAWGSGGSAEVILNAVVPAFAVRIA